MALKQIESPFDANAGRGAFTPDPGFGSDSPASAPALDTLADLRRAAQRIYAGQIGAALDRGTELQPQQVRVGIALLQLIRGTIRDEAQLARVRPPVRSATIELAALVPLTKRDGPAAASREQTDREAARRGSGDHAAGEEVERGPNESGADPQNSLGAELQECAEQPEGQALPAASDSEAPYYLVDDEELDGTVDGAADGSDSHEMAGTADGPGEIDEESIHDGPGSGATLGRGEPRPP